MAPVWKSIFIKPELKFLGSYKHEQDGEIIKQHFKSVKQYKRFCKLMNVIQVDIIEK
jgi:hypothetical protein